MKTAMEIHEEPQQNNWIVTFADLMTLLLVFFVLLFSISTLEEDIYVKTIESVKTALKGTGAGTIEDPFSIKTETGTVPTDSTDPSVETGDKQQAPTVEELPVIITPFNPAPPQPQTSREDQQKSQDLARVSQSVSQLMKSATAKGQAKTYQETEGKIVISVRGDLFFAAGSAQFNREAMPIMDGIGNILRKNTQFNLAIGGHTDNVPISTNRYPSNWELSAIRATSVLRYFVRGGMRPDRVTATGYGESMPLTANNTEEQRNQNRRIEFVLEREPQ
ncbi:MAG: OmpA family protein [Pseudomonadales bacterium]|nr:OmpA family protein [Pseudomonadales bacterium]